MDIVVIVASHNRRALTTQCLQDAVVSIENAGFGWRIVLYDDGSTDGTSDAVTKLFDDKVVILHGDGSAFWARSMHQAEKTALHGIDRSASDREPDLILWLNDDTSVSPSAIGVMARTLAPAYDAIATISMRDPTTEQISYGGYLRDGPHPLSYVRVQPDPTLTKPIDAFNGNCVLVPSSVAHVLGGIDGRYSHALADIDYSKSAKSKGITLLLAPGIGGTCSRNVPSRLSHSTKISDVVDMWREFTSIKGGGNPQSLRLVLRKHDRTTWMFFFAATYILWTGRTLARCLTPDKRS